MRASDVFPVMGTAGTSGRLLFQGTAAFLRPNANFSSNVYHEDEDTANLTLVFIFIFKMSCSVVILFCMWSSLGVQ